MAAFEDSYGAITARYYDGAYAALDGADVAFYRALAAETGGPVLELGCGTGRVLLEIARDGHDCVGVDLSPAMLEALRAKAGPRGPRLVCAPMQRFDLEGQRFALVFSAFRAFQHLHGVEDQLETLMRVRRHLAPGGRFAFDVFHPRLERIALDGLPEQEDARFRDGEGEVVRFTRVDHDRVEQLVHVTMRYERRSEGAALEVDEVRFRMRWFLRFELEHLLARAGFDEVTFYGNFDRSPLTRASPAYVVVAQATRSVARSEPEASEGGLPLGRRSTRSVARSEPEASEGGS